MPDREYFRIGEVAEILGVPPSAVRFWKDRFAPHIRPLRTGARQHVFSRRDLSVLALIRHLVHDRKLSIREARDEVATALSEHGGDTSFILVGQQGELPLGATVVAASAGQETVNTALQAELDAERRRADEAEARLAAVRAAVADLLAGI